MVVLLYGWMSLAFLLMTMIGTQSSPLNAANTLGCHRRLYTYRATKVDKYGNACWDTISAMACWGRCDSNEISDWIFPYKRSHHPVCIHGKRIPHRTILRNCDPDAIPGTEQYEYHEAAACKCKTCSSSDTSCEGQRYHSPTMSFKDELLSDRNRNDPLIFHQHNDQQAPEFEDDFFDNEVHNTDADSIDYFADSYRVNA